MKSLDKSFQGSFALQADAQKVLAILKDIKSVEFLAPGVQSVLKMDEQNKEALVKLKMSFGSLSFDREVLLSLREIEHGVKLKASTYGLELEANVFVQKADGGCVVNYSVSAKSTSFAGALVLNAVGDSVVKQFAEEFEQRIKKALLEVHAF